MAGAIDKIVFFSLGSTLCSLDISSSEVRKFHVHKETITSLLTQSRKLYTGGADGLIVIWNLPNYTKIDTSAPIKMLTASTKNLYFICGNNLQINILDLTTSQIQHQTILKGQVSDVIGMQMFPDESNLAILKGTSFITYNLTTQVTKTFEHTVPLSCLKIHPEQKYIVVGDTAGQIIKFFPNNSKQKLHWHSHKVTTLKFTSDGSYLISGGEEGVLVLWHESSGNQTFLPRLGSTIIDFTISDDNSFYVVKLLDNSVKVVSSTDNKIISRYEGLTDPSKILPYNRIFTGLVRYEELYVLNGSPGYIQFFNPNSNQVIRFDCVKRNPVSRTHRNYPYPLQVIQVAFLPSINAMATIEASNSPNFSITYLKFWNDNKLNTLILHPHSDTANRIISYQDSFVSIGNSSFIVWKFEEKEWRNFCEKKLWELVPTDLCENKGNLVVVFEHIISIWNQNFEKEHEIYEPEGNWFIQIKSAKDFLVARTQEKIFSYRNNLMVWNLRLDFVHGIEAEGNHFIIGLNASKVTPKDLREKRTNILLKFDAHSSIPEKIYKVSYPKAFSLYNNQTIIIDKNFEFVNLDVQMEIESDQLPELEKPEQIERKETQKYEAAPRYLSTKSISELDEVKSFELPSMEKLFEEIVCKELESFSLE
ncbi:unnamed protein product [Blepharisma stoltei]|uniref:WD40 repeat-like protein n=1 Tax=Blepharisma stoltei TaxID=1481888 RepID=A0AAU9JVP1_9CILI|nr:unnamed protein product [Blepharisma stoltei]